MIVPYSTEVLIRRLPLGNLLIMGACILSYLLLATGFFPLGLLEWMILGDWNPAGLLGYQFIHFGFWHLLFNMLYLWVFGNTVNEKVGSAPFAVIFLLTGALAGALHLLLDGNPAIGASGSINGIIGFYLVIHPINRVNCFYWMIRPGTFAVKGFWLILFWFACDAWSAFRGNADGIAYWAHVGGFLAGFALAFLFLKMGWAKMAEYDNPTLLDYMTGKGEVSYVTAKTPARTVIEHPRLPSRPPVPAVSPPVRKIVRANCPHCDHVIDISTSRIGSLLVCPACRGEIQIEGE